MLPMTLKWLWNVQLYMDDNIAKCTENFVGECFIGKNIISNFIYYLVIVVLIHRKLFCFIT